MRRFSRTVESAIHGSCWIHVTRRRTSSPVTSSTSTRPSRQVPERGARKRRARQPGVGGGHLHRPLFEHQSSLEVTGDAEGEAGEDRLPQPEPQRPVEPAAIDVALFAPHQPSRRDAGNEDHSGQDRAADHVGVPKNLVSRRSASSPLRYPAGLEPRHQHEEPDGEGDHAESGTWW